jgi:hypothetical protein
MQIWRNDQGYSLANIIQTEAEAVVASLAHREITKDEESAIYGLSKSPHNDRAITDLERSWCRLTTVGVVL